MTLQRVLLAAAIAAAMPVCHAAQKADAAPAKPTAADADRFVKAINDKARAEYPEQTASAWLSVTYINADSQLVAAKTNERALGDLKRNVEKATEFDGLKLAPDTERALKLLKLWPYPPSLLRP